MHGMVGSITTKMAKERTKNKIKKEISVKTKVLNNPKIAVVAILAIIAIILIILINSIANKKIGEQVAVYKSEPIEVIPNENPRIEKFIKEYFKARTDLNYSKIFASYGRDYYKEEREARDDAFKKTIDNIRYERMFVKGYSNIYIYTEEGYYENETVCIVTYDMEFGFTDDVAPTIVIFYLVKNGDTYIIKDKLDVGTSKYLVDVVNIASVKNLYNEIYKRLTRILNSNESLKLAYNSYRQSEMNMKSTLGPLNKKQTIESIGPKKLDVVNDAKQIYDSIVEIKKKQKQKEELDNYLNRVIASLSYAQRK